MSVFRDGDAPDFNPHATGSSGRGGGKGRRFTVLLWVVGAGALGTWYVSESWRDWFPAQAAEEKPPIRTSQAAVIPVEEPPIKVESAPPPTPTPEANAPPPGRSAGSAPRGRQEFAFNVAQASAPDMSWYRDARRPHVAHGCALRPGGNPIRAALTSVVQSEIGGQAEAQVTEDVMDVDGVGRRLIPLGSKLIGRYKTTALDFNRRRLDFVWTELLIFPSEDWPQGAQLYLANASGQDAAGSMGVGGRVDTRWGELVATAALLTVFDGIQRGGVSSEPGLLGSIQDAASSNTGQLGKDVTRRVLDWEPNILIPSGTRITVAVNQTLRVC